MTTKAQLQAKADAAHEARVRGGKNSRRIITPKQQAALQDARAALRESEQEASERTARRVEQYLRGI